MKNLFLFVVIFSVFLTLKNSFAIAAPIDECLVSNIPNRTIIEFGEKKIISSGTEEDASSDVTVSIDPGMYDITLIGSDSYVDRINVTQPNESWKLILKDGDGTVTETNATPDLEDQVETAFQTLFEENFVISSAVNLAVAYHPMYPAENPNSVFPECAVLDFKANLPSDDEDENEGNDEEETSQGIVVDNNNDNNDSEENNTSNENNNPNNNNVNNQSILGDNNSDTGGGGGGSSGSKRKTLTLSNVLNIPSALDNLEGQVLGAETSCGIYVDKFLRKGYKNDIEAVKKIQTFLNNYRNAGLAVDGIYGSETENSIKSFQVAHADKILVPWGITEPTGIFYLTTQREVNNIMCPELDLPIPMNLIPWGVSYIKFPPKL